MIAVDPAFRMSCVIVSDTIRYDTRCYFSVRSKADMSQLNLPLTDALITFIVFSIKHSRVGALFTSMRYNMAFV